PAAAEGPGVARGAVPAGGSSYGWPGYRPGRAWMGELVSGTEHGRQAAAQGGQLPLAEQVAQAVRELARLHRGGRPLQVSLQCACRRLPREVPDHGAQLGLDVEGEAVVDHPDASLGIGEAVS